MIFDAVCFFNEIDLLEFRMKLLDSTVDFFVISEANLTHSGKPKPYYFEENKDRFKEWEHKIIYYPIELSTEGLQFNKVDSYTPDDGSWILENAQRNALLYLNEKVKDDDIVMISDVDEIPNYRILKAIKSGLLKIHTSKSLIQSFHYFWMNYRMKGRDEFWRGTVIVPGNEFILNTPQDFRDNRNNYNAIAYGGWHFSYLGGVEKIIKKIESFAHTEFNRDDIKSEENIRQALEEGKDIFGRNDIRFEKLTSVDGVEYPPRLINLMRQYPQFIKQ